MRQQAYQPYSLSPLKKIENRQSFMRISLAARLTWDEHCRPSCSPVALRPGVSAGLLFSENNWLFTFLSTGRKPVDKRIVRKTLIESQEKNAIVL